MKFIVPMGPALTTGRRRRPDLRLGSSRGAAMEETHQRPSFTLGGLLDLPLRVTAH